MHAALECDVRGCPGESGTRYLPTDQNCAPPGYNAASIGKYLIDVSGQPIGPILKCKESKK